MEAKKFNKKLMLLSHASTLAQLTLPWPAARVGGPVWCCVYCRTCVVCYTTCTCHLRAWVMPRVHARPSRPPPPGHVQGQ